MDIKLFSFSKRTNSTKRPIMATGRSFTCTLLENTSMESPVIKLKAPLDLQGIEETTVSGPIVTINNNVPNMPIKAIGTTIDYTGSGFTGLTLTKCGKNFLTPPTFSASTESLCLDLGQDISGESFTLSFLATNAEVVNVTSAIVDFKESNGTHHYRTLNDFKDSNNVSFSASGQNNGVFKYTSTYTFRYVYISYTSNWRSKFTSDSLSNWQLELGSTATTYVPYTAPTTLSVNWQNPIYGGLYDFDTGILTSNKASDGSDITPTYYHVGDPVVMPGPTELTNFYTDVGTTAVKYYIYSSSSGHMYDFNYAYISDLHRYYYIGNRIYTLGTWTMELRLDVLATHKYAIGASTHYIERASYESNPYVIDSIYPLQTNQTLVIQKPEKVADKYPSIFGTTITPSYVLGLIGGIDPDWDAQISRAANIHNGSVIYFLLTEAQMGKFITEIMMEDVDLYAIPVSELSKPLQRQLINPIQYIHSISCIPFYPVPLSYYYVKSVQLGFNYIDIPDRATESWRILPAPTVGDNTTNNGYMVKNQCDIRMPLHPSYDDKGHWVLSDPYSKYVLHIGPYGEIQIPSGEIMRATVHGSVGSEYLQLYITTVFDISTGECTLFLAFDSTSCDDAFLEVTKNLSIPIPVHQAMQDVASHRQARRDLAYQQIGAVMDIAKSVIGFTGGGTQVAGGETVTDMGGESVTIGQGRLGQANIGGSGPISTALNAQAKMMNTIDSATRANQVTISGNGNEGSYMSFNQDLCTPRMFCYFSPFVEEYNEEKGRPLCKVKQISTIPGYIQCSGAEIETYGVVSENEAIAAFLNGGFYYE